MSATTSLGESCIVGTIKGVQNLQVSNLTVSTGITVPTLTANTVNTTSLAVSGTVAGPLAVAGAITSTSNISASSLTANDITSTGGNVLVYNNITSTNGVISAVNGYFRGAYVLYSAVSTNGGTPNVPVSTQNIAWNSSNFKYIWYIPVSSATAFTQTLKVSGATFTTTQTYSPRLTVQFFGGLNAVFTTTPAWTANVLYTVQGDGSTAQNYQIYITNSTAAVFSGGTCYIKVVLWLEPDS